MRVLGYDLTGDFRLPRRTYIYILQRRYARKYLYGYYIGVYPGGCVCVVRQRDHNTILTNINFDTKEKKNYWIGSVDAVLYTTREIES